MDITIRDLFKYCTENNISSYEFFKNRGFIDTITSFNGEHKISLINKDLWVNCGYQSFCCHMDTIINLKKEINYKKPEEVV